MDRILGDSRYSVLCDAFVSNLCSRFVVIWLVYVVFLVFIFFFFLFYYYYYYYFTGCMYVRKKLYIMAPWRMEWQLIRECHQQSAVANRKIGLLYIQQHLFC